MFELLSDINVRGEYPEPSRTSKMKPFAKRVNYSRKKLQLRYTIVF